MEQEYDSKRETLNNIINDILSEKDEENSVEEISEDTSLTEDIGLDSLDLAEMTVRLEDKYGVDVFEDDVVDTVNEVLKKLEK